MTLNGTKVMPLHSKKSRALEALVAKRRMNVPTGYCCVGSFHDGAYDADGFVVPWTKSACNLDAEVFLLGQDWASEAFLSKPLDHELIRFGQKASWPTNRNLARLLPDHLGLSFHDTYATNAFPFVKPGRMDTSIWHRDLVSCTREYALPQIAVIKPLLVICLGRSSTFRAVCDALGAKPGCNASAGLPLGPVHHRAAEIWGVNHTSAWGSMDKERVKREWSFLATRLKELRAAAAAERLRDVAHQLQGERTTEAGHIHCM